MTRRHIGLGVLVFIAAVIVYFTGIRVVAQRNSVPESAVPNAGYNTNTPGTTSGTTLPPVVPPGQAPPVMTGLPNGTSYAPPPKPTEPQNTPPSYKQE